MHRGTKRLVQKTDEVNVIDTSMRTLGVQFISDHHQTFETVGYAGQSFGAFINESVELIHTGYANDYVGKGLSGGQITIKVDETTRQKANQDPTYTSRHLIAGNTILYGATSGTCVLLPRPGDTGVWTTRLYQGVGEGFTFPNCAAHKVCEKCK